MEDDLLGDDWVLFKAFLRIVLFEGMVFAQVHSAIVISKIKLSLLHDSCRHRSADEERGRGLDADGSK